jgi:hypothetical protein
MTERLGVPLLRFLAHRLARTKFGQKALSQPEEGLSILKQKPSSRFYIGLALLVISLLLGFPVLAFLGYLSVKLSRPMLIAVGGPVAVLLVHVMFGVGIYLAGKNYALETLLWMTKRFLKRFV